MFHFIFDFETFQDARTRQRLMTSTSTTPNDVNEQVDRQLDQLDEQTIERLNEPHPPNDVGTSICHAN